MDSDGNLLDSDTSLAKDWSFPVLPEGNSSLPSSSQELADIFGTSDDEEDVDFPFGLTSDLPVPEGFDDIALPEGGTKSFGNSLLSNVDSELFLNNFQSGIGEKNVETAVGVPMETKAAESKGQNVEEDKEEAVSEQAEETQDNPKEQAVESSSTTQETPQDSPKITPSEEPALPPTDQSSSVVRKSARIRAKLGGTDSSSGSSSEQETQDTKRKTVEDTKQKTVEESVPVKSDLENVNDNSEAKEVESTVDTKGDESVKPMSDEGGESSDESEGDESDEEEDPDKLYCICQQTHDDRFMICCDSCEDWFHGNCVGITVAQGKRMEREGREYVCPVCLEKQQISKEETSANRSARQQQREATREKVIKKKLGLTDPAHTPTKSTHRRRTLSASTPHTPTDSDTYGLSQLFLPDNAPKDGNAMGEVSSTTEQGGVVKTEDIKPNSNELLNYKCMIEGCDRTTVPPSVYCSQECITKHVTTSLKKLTSYGVSIQSNPSQFVRGSGGIGVIDMATNKIMVGICAPSEKELIPWLQAHPSYQVLVHRKGKGKAKKLKVKKEKEETKYKYPKIALMDPDSVRANAKKALYQILWKRRESAPDMSNIDQAEVEKIAHDIEEKLFNLNRDINPKYKNKYRSLIFNLKDLKNQGLFRKVLHKEISTRDLVRMSSEKLASTELAAWRESTLKKNLEMIKIREEEAAALGEVIRKVTHKGEVEIDSSEIADTVIENTSDPTDQVSEVNSEKSNPVDTKPHSKKQKPDSKPTDSTSHKDTSSGGILDLLTNTTSQHGTHLYDHHCDICTGKIKPPSTPPQASPDSRMEDVEMKESTEHTSPDSVARPMSLLSPQDSANKVIWKGSVSMVGLTKFASTAYPVSGNSSDLYGVFPDTLHLMGRIAYVQVWDYLDKLRSSSSREIVVLRLDWMDEEKDAYVSMFNYLVRKHRSGVISSGYKGIKDMYLVPLPGHWDVPQQLLPFNGPGLPVDRADMLLGVIVRSKSRKHRHHHLQDSPSPTTQIRAEVTLKRHHSASDEANNEGFQKKRSRLEVGFGDQTPPISTKTGGETSHAFKKEPTEDDDSAPYSPSSILEDASFDAALDSKTGGSSSLSKPEEKKATTKSVQMSFYGEHRPPSSSSSFTQPQTKSTSATVNSEIKLPLTGATPNDKSAKVVPNINTSVMAASLKTKLNLPPTTDIQNLLANLSGDKLKELASAVSNLEKISEGPIDQSTLSAANVQTALSSAAHKPSIPTPQPITDTTSSPIRTDSQVTQNSSNPNPMPQVAHEQKPSQFAPRTVQVQEQHHQAQGPQPHQAHDSQPHQAHDSQPHQAQDSHLHQAHDSQPHQAQGPHLHQTQGVQPHQAQNAQVHPPHYRTDQQWDQRPHHHDVGQSRSFDQYTHQPQDGQQGFQQQQNYQQHGYHQNPDHSDHIQHSYSRSPPNDSSYHQQSQYQERGWHDQGHHHHPRWGQQQDQHFQQEQPPHTDPNYDKGDKFRGRPMRGYRGSRGFRGRGFRGGRRGAWHGDGSRHGYH